MTSLCRRSASGVNFVFNVFLILQLLCNISKLTMDFKA